MRLCFVIVLRLLGCVLAQLVFRHIGLPEKRCREERVGLQISRSFRGQHLLRNICLKLRYRPHKVSPPARPGVHPLGPSQPSQ